VHDAQLALERCTPRQPVRGLLGKAPDAAK